MQAPATPELDRHRQIINSGEADTVQNFYEWLAGEGLQLCRLHDVGRIDPQYIPDGRTPEQLIAAFFGLDLNKLEDERRAVLQALNAAQAGCDR